MIVDVIRHGLTAANLAGRFNVDDELLTPDEFERLQGAGFRAADYRCVFSSPARRCLDTAMALGLEVQHIDARLAERRFGIFAGLTPSECRQTHGQAFEAFSRFDGEFVIPGGESRSQHFDRLSACFGEISRRNDDPVLVITHGGTLDFLYRIAHGVPLYGGNKIHAGQNAAVSCFSVEWPRIEMISFSTPLLD